MGDSNPYSPPSESASSLEPQGAERQLASKWCVSTILWLLGPACANWAVLFGNSNAFTALFTLAQLVAMTVALLAFSFRAIEWLSRVLHRIFGREVSLERWMQSMYVTLTKLAWIGPVGAIVFTLWVICYFGLGLQTFQTTLIFSAVGHILGVCIYGSIFLNWYRLRRPSV